MKLKLSAWLDTTRGAVREKCFYLDLFYRCHYMLCWKSIKAGVCIQEEPSHVFNLWLSPQIQILKSCVSAVYLLFHYFTSLGFRFDLCVLFLCSHPLLDFSASPGFSLLPSLLPLTPRSLCVFQVTSTGTALRMDGQRSTPPMRRPASSQRTKRQNQR